MNAVERVKKICKEQKIPISKLEADLGFGNAYISGLKKGMFPADRLKKIAKYLNVSDDYLATGKNPPVPQPSSAKEHVELIALYEQLTDEQKIAVKNLMISMVK